MNTAVLTSPISRPDRPNRFLAPLKTLFEGVQEGRRLAASYDRLTRLSNSELARLGLAREEIPQAVAHGY